MCLQAAMRCSPCLGADCSPCPSAGMQTRIFPLSERWFLLLTACCENPSNKLLGLMEKSSPTFCAEGRGIATLQPKSPAVQPGKLLRPAWGRARACVGDRGVPVLGITVTELMLFGFGNGKDLKGCFLGS